MNPPPNYPSVYWEAVERCLAAAARAEELRERSQQLREASRLIREECARLSRYCAEVSRKSEAARFG